MRTSWDLRWNGSGTTIVTGPTISRTRTSPIGRRRRPHRLSGDWPQQTCGRPIESLLPYSRAVNRAISTSADMCMDVVRPRYSGELLIKDVLGYPPGHMERRLKYPALRRVNEARGKILLRHLLRYRFRRHDEHLLGHTLRFGREYHHAHGRKDIDVVSLPGHKRPAGELYRREWAPARENGGTVRPIIGLRSRALGTRCGVGIGENNRTVVDLSHRLDHLPIEKFWNRADADDAGRLERLDRVDKHGHRGPVLRKRLLKVPEIVSRRHHQATGIKQSVGASCLCKVHPLQPPALADQLRDASRSRTAAEEQEPLIGDLLPGDAQSSQDSGYCHSCRALYVVVIRTNLVAISFQDRDRVEISKILPLDAAFRIERLHRLNERVNEGLILLTANAVLAQAKIKGIIEQLLIICAYVQDDRQAELRRHTSARRIKRELADRDAHPANPEITEAEDAFPVGNDDEAYVLLWPVAQDFAYTISGGDRQVHSSRRMENTIELLAGLANRRRIDQWHEGGGVRHQDRIE